MMSIGRIILDLFRQREQGAQVSAEELIAEEISQLIIENLDEILEEISLNSPSEFYQRNWWLLVDNVQEGIGRDLVGRRPLEADWPPFTGLRVPLGDDGV